MKKIMVLFFVVGVISILLGFFIMNYLFKPKNQPEVQIQQFDEEDMNLQYLSGNIPIGNIEALKKSNSELIPFELYAIGYNSPRAIGFWKLDYFVSSYQDSTIYRIIPNEDKKQFSFGNFVSDMVFDDNGTIIAPVYQDNTLYRIPPTGMRHMISSSLSGPAGIAWSPGGCYYVSEYLSGNISCIESSGKTTRIIEGLEGPLGLLLSDKKLYITNYLSETSSIVMIPLSKIGKEKPFIISSGLMHTSAIGVIDESIYAVHIKEGYGVVSKITSQSKSQIVAISDLPDPVFAKFTKDRYVYLLSPNDPDGRIMRARFPL